ncbi:hypothetical protein P9E76_19600 [Schinkia azotoformans]|uniref:Uncharacterized protein n=1 Tax=Schinkia azotoformans LMG 9581 TaxID=1131731 RepID=K6D4D2_SCHAZ|nr:hypothetical protein [Schinkia azotoformans]EKN62913.1 hypothetical protein BAZO_19743 [Schinkia azotoformans LMG 9581]MEC1639816.1 hypothetical protein [Schinkia azotoformans]MEC1719798.1 hypothetical protein [Schinkia azotoformans]MEC1947213.1 hypothetical protein [Schinkia azotoformans]MED4354615.1 hypothetical protein [Schinkia azotoformans]
MNLVLTYMVNVVVIAMSIFFLLYFGSERKRKFEEKNAMASFHICNVLFIIMTSSAAHVVMTVYIIEDMSKIIFQIAFLLFITLSLYLLGNIVFEHYKFMLKRYVKAENGKVLVLNKAYLKRK